MVGAAAWVVAWTSVWDEADCDGAAAKLDTGWVTELTTLPTVLVTGVATDWTTPVTVDVTPESSDGSEPVAALACPVGTARRNAVPPVAIANPATRRAARRVLGFDIANSSHRENRACRTEAVPWG